MIFYSAYKPLRRHFYDSMNEHHESFKDQLELIKNLSNSIQSNILFKFHSTLDFKNISCKNISNDCLDVSAAKVNGSKLIGNNIKDKGLSFGENSSGKITDINFQYSKLGVAVKDGSKLRLTRYLLKNNQYDVAVFNKKKEYDGAILKINNSVQKNELNYLIGTNNFIFKDELVLTKIIDNKIINQIFY